MKEGSTLIGFLQPYTSTAEIRTLAARRVTAFSMELMPRITRAQPMDALSAMSTISGYKAGLLAIGTAKRLGAVVEAYDTRPTVREQVESLGARFVEVDLETKDAEDKTGYARAQSEEFYTQQRQMMSRYVTGADVVITTALVPGRRGPGPAAPGVGPGT